MFQGWWFGFGLQKFPEWGCRFPWRRAPQGDEAETWQICYRSSMDHTQVLHGFRLKVHSGSVDTKTFLPCSPEHHLNSEPSLHGSRSLSLIISFNGVHSSVRPEVVEILQSGLKMVDQQSDRPDADIVCTIRVELYLFIIRVKTLQRCTSGSDSGHREGCPSVGPLSGSIPQLL